MSRLPYFLINYPCVIHEPLLHNSFPVHHPQVVSPQTPPGEEVDGLPYPIPTPWKWVREGVTTEDVSGPKDRDDG